LNYLGNEILKEDGFIKNGLFYDKLEEYIKFYQEVIHLLKETNTDILLNDKINSLPDFKFIDYNNPLSFKSIFYGIGYILFFPMGIIYLIQKYRYVAETKEKLRETYTLLSSLAFLAKEK
jgi:hypothetical protein